MAGYSVIFTFTIIYPVYFVLSNLLVSLYSFSSLHLFFFASCFMRLFLNFGFFFSCFSLCLRYSLAVIFCLLLLTSLFVHSSYYLHSSSLLIFKLFVYFLFLFLFPVALSYNLREDWRISGPAEWVCACFIKWSLIHGVVSYTVR